MTDGQTDGHRCSGYTSTCIACYTTTLIKRIKDDNIDNYKVHNNKKQEAQLLLGDRATRKHAKDS